MLVFSDPAIDTDHPPYNQEGKEEINDISPPTGPRRRFYPDDDGIICFHNALVVVGDPHFKGIFSGRQVGVESLPIVAGIDPQVIEPFHHVMVVYSLVFSIIEGCKRDGKTVMVMLQMYVGVVPETFGYDLILQRRYKLIVYLQVLE